MIESETTIEIEIIFFFLSIHFGYSKQKIRRGGGNKQNIFKINHMRNVSNELYSYEIDILVDQNFILISHSSHFLNHFLFFFLPRSKIIDIFYR